MVVQAVRTASKEQKVVRSFHASLPLAAAVAAYISALATSTYYPAHEFLMPFITLIRTTVLSAVFFVFKLLLGYVRASKNIELETHLKPAILEKLSFNWKMW